MDAGTYKRQAEQYQGLIFSEKITQLRIKLDIEKVKTQGFNHDLRTAQIQTNTKAIKTQIAEVNYSIANTDLQGTRGKAALNEQKWRAELEGGRDELLALQESIQIRIATLRQKNLQAMGGLD